MATYPSILAWKILWAEEPGGLHFLGCQRVEHDQAQVTCSFRHQISKVFSNSLQSKS